MKRTIMLILAGTMMFCLGFQLSELRKSTAEPVPTAAAARMNEATPVDDEVEISAECNGMAISNNEKILDYKGESISPASISGENTLVARFSTSACRPCVNALTASLNKFAAAHPDWHIVLMLKNIQLRDLYVIAPDFGPQFSLYACDSLAADFDNADTPVLFQLSPEGRIQNHFTCKYGNYDRTDRYLDTLQTNKA